MAIPGCFMPGMVYTSLYVLNDTSALYDVVAVPTPSYLRLESGPYLLQEDNSRFVV
jgi:hypothetical protein